MRIYRYLVASIEVVRDDPHPVGSYPISMIRHAEVLCAQIQDSDICIWAKVNELLTEHESRIIDVVATGATMDIEPRRYINTLQYGPYVWHVFVR